MRVAVRAFLPSLLLTGLAFTALSCSDTTEPPNAATVQVQNDSFNPDSATVSTGGSVTWQWAAGSSDHNVTWVTQSTNSPTQATGTYTRTFSTAGTYDYYCTLHGTATSGMHGSVVVQ